jgi:CheY-like chemotaxis protein
MGPTILVIDDDQGIRDVLLEVLSTEGYRVATATNGREALSQLEDRTLPSLILLDLMMPVMDGWQFRAQQSADPRLARIPVVILSADRRAKQAATLLGAAGCLVKPVGLDELLSVVSRHAA